MRFEIGQDSTSEVGRVRRLAYHHDYSKCLFEAYVEMRQKETYSRMRDPTFAFDRGKMDALGTQHFSSLILKLPAEQEEPFFSRVRGAYETLESLVKEFDSQGRCRDLL